MQRFFPGWLLPVLVGAALALIFFFQLAFTDLILARGDTYAYFYPYWDVRDASLSEGELPLWTNNLFMGAPLMANSQLGTLYPPNWISIDQSAPEAVKISILIHTTWGFLGAYWLAKRGLNLSLLPALASGLFFTFGGYISAHVEQINQYQGLAWVPWLFLFLHLSLKGSMRYVLLFGAAWAMQLLTGHTQVAFMSGIGLGSYAVFFTLLNYDRVELFDRQLTPIPRTLLILIGAVLIAIILASPQLIPSQELISVSSRGDALNPQEATAFSLNPLLIGRTMLPSYDAQPFTEYLGYIGVIGLGLAVLGLFSTDKRCWLWIGLAALGVFFAFGRGNPLYMLLVELPGFNLFRVPARWLILWSLSAAMLAGLGLESLRQPISGSIFRRYLPVFTALIMIVALVVLSQLSNRASDEIDGSALPTATTWAGWMTALGALLVVVVITPMIPRLQRYQIPFLCLLVFVELLTASQFLPYHDLSDPAVYRDPRFAINQMHVLTEDQSPPGRFLSISGLLFDPGDKAALQARWDNMGISDRAAQYAFTASKLEEVIGGNLPLTWDIASADGYGGGVLPTANYTAFSSLLLPDGVPRTTDGRLREWMAQPECRGACIPEDRWLDLMNVQYLMTDKVYDVVHEGIFYDTQLHVMISNMEALRSKNPRAFEADMAHVLYTCPEAECHPPDIVFNVGRIAWVLDSIETDTTIDGLRLARYFAPHALLPDSISIAPGEIMDIYALTLVDTRTNDFVQITPPGWERIYSADVKIYENLDVLPRAFVVHDVMVFPDDWDGTEKALEFMREPGFNPGKMAVINTDENLSVEDPSHRGVYGRSSVTITQYTDTEIYLLVESNANGFVILTDAYYPGWVADSGRTPIYRADVMFRAIPIKAGESIIRLSYEPPLTLSFSSILIGYMLVSLGFGATFVYLNYRDDHLM